MASNFLLSFKENRATFDSSARLQNYVLFGISLNELGTSKAMFLHGVTVDILGWIILCLGWGAAL